MSNDDCMITVNIIRTVVL